MVAKSGGYVYELTPPSGKKFFGAIRPREGNLELLTTRTGKWKIDPVLKWADMVMPEQDLNEWDVKPINPKDAPQPLPEGVLP